MLESAALFEESYQLREIGLVVQAFGQEVEMIGHQAEGLK